MKKNLRFLALTGFAIVLIAGCGTPSTTGESATTGVATNPPPTTNQTTGAKPKIGISIPAADHGWTAGVGYWAKVASDLHPEIEWKIVTADKPEKQISDIENLMSWGAQGLVVLATQSAQITPVAKQAHDRGIFLVNVDRGFLEPVADVFLEGDNKAFGRKSAEYMAKKLGDKGKIVILRGIPSTVDTDRVDAAMEVFKSKPGIEIVGVQEADWNREKAANVMQSLLSKNPHIDAVWASDDDMALGAEQSIKEAGRQDEMWILGGAGMKDIVKRVMDGDKMYPADITYPPSMIGAGVELAASALAGGNSDKKKQFLPRHIMIDIEEINPGNAKGFYFPDSVY